MEIADIIKKVEAGDNVNANKAFDTVMGSPAKSVKKYNKLNNKNFTAYGTPTDIDYEVNK